METLSSAYLYRHLKNHIPRILSQLDRDADSPTFGSFDRNYWHYKIRDFSSMILQQGMLILQAIKNYDNPDNPWFENRNVDLWQEGAVKFWCKEQLKNGSFNEYYPFEAGYPPTAFSLYAIGLIMREYEKEPCDKIKTHIQKTVKWLLDHPEKEALNQEAAGLAGLVLASKVPGVSVNPKALEDRLKWFYAQQTDEGWFPEYGGPDMGYLTVTIDCLWDIYETSKDKRALTAIDKAVRFIADMVSVSGETPVMINSRNTDYLVPYGITRYAEKSPVAASLLETMLEGMDNADHFIHRTDDRYSCHYVGQSFFRTLLHLDKVTEERAEPAYSTGLNHTFEEAGISVIHIPEKTSLYIYSRKGGIVNVFDKKGITHTDFGWRQKTGKEKFAVTHWLDEDYKLATGDNEWSITGNMTAHGWMKSSPVRHMGLRVLSKTFGNRLIPFLKKLMIFGNPKTEINFNRKISFNGADTINIVDQFSGSAFNPETLVPAPHYSLRHVASAGLFVPEERIELPEYNSKKHDPEGKNYTFVREIKL
ncbi:MAG: hypothetical protein C0593_08900 [Marinilabiliales bacterium]|nr:MAG: hypothetical protein C0593_08900 [Marinilabiliales bacterium]